MSLIISAKNYGPIADGTVELKPFTVFVGPNNTGKSYLSTLIYAAELNQRSTGLYIPSAVPPVGPSSVSNNRIIARLRERLARRFQAPDPDLAHLFSHMTDSDRASLRRLIVSDLNTYAISVQSELERCFATGLGDLARVARGDDEPMDVTVHDTSERWSVRIRYHNKVTSQAVTRSPSIKAVTQIANRAALEIFSRLFLPMATAETSAAIPVEDIPRAFLRDVGADASEVIASNLVSEMHRILFRSFPASRHYLPAARSGTMQSHRTLAGLLVRSAPLAGLQQMSVPQMNGILADFISQLISFDPRRAARRTQPLEPVARHLEHAVLHGTIEVRTDAQTSYPEIIFRIGEFEGPLHRLSSMVSELAPVVIYIRYVLRPGNHLIIEEPEAHLHPQSQREFAHVLADLSARGVYTTMTTHSDYLLTEINNLIRGSTVAKALDESHASAPTLPADSVAAYLFKANDYSAGTTVDRLEITRQDGIPDSEFGRVAEAIYDEAASLQYRIIQATNGPVVR